MFKLNNIKCLPAILLLAVTFSCNWNEEGRLPTLCTDNFESGNIGEKERISDTEWELYLANDNYDPELQDNWRNWWYVEMSNLVLDAPTQITLKNRGWPNYYVPVYTYDQQQWFRFTENEVVQNDNNELIITRQYENERIRLARFYPYTFSDLENYLDGISSNQFLNIEIAGQSQGNKPIYLLKLTDSGVPSTSKKRIFMHARTHPAETCPSFLLEGMIDFLLSGSQQAEELLAMCEFYIFPMQNVDGVIAGNYRTTPMSENLEVLWKYDQANPINLVEGLPQEVSIVHQYAKQLMTDGGPPVSIALNLHASNSEPDGRPFFFPHFGTEAQGYSSDEASLWEKQIAFISYLAGHHRVDMLEPIQEEGGSSFASKTYPESWWWVNFQDQVMAITMEMTYGRAGYAPRWIVPDDLRDLGVNLALGIHDYVNGAPVPFMEKSARNFMNLKYPELYPPNAEDELKE